MTIKTGNLVRINNLEILRHGVLAEVIDTNNEDAVLIKFTKTDNQEQWILNEDLTIVELN